MNARERDLLDAAELLVDGKWRDASRAFDSILIEYPHDALAIQTAHLMDFFQGDALNLRNRISRVLPHWSEQTPGYSYILGMHAFGLGRMQSVSRGRAHRAPRARAAAARRLGGARSDACDGDAGPYCAKASTGCSRANPTGRRTTCSRRTTGGTWRLFNMDLGKFDVALDLFDQKLMGPQPDMILVLLDATALLWRLRLEGVDVGDRFERVADLWKGKLEDEAGYYAFNDVHAMMSFAATGRTGEIARLRRAMRNSAKGDRSNAVDDARGGSAAG